MMLAVTGSVTIFLVLLTVCIVIGHLLEARRWVNVSVTALLIGLAIGGAILLTSRGRNSPILQFNEQIFFKYLLPPIIFNAGFQVKKEHFFKNFMAILVYGIIGTLLSFGTIAFGASKLFKALNIDTLGVGDYTAMGAILSATDSVSTLQILNQDETPLLYSLVFGEGVVNDATSVVIFNAINKLDMSHLHSATFWKFLGNLSTLLVASTLPGILIGLLSAFIIKKFSSTGSSTYWEVALMIIMAYLSYVVASVLDLSGILSVFFSGIVMSQYTWHNMTENSRITTKHGFATISFILETFIFLYVGMEAQDMEKWILVSNNPVKSLGASAILLALVLLGRAAFVFPLSFIINLTKTRSDKISLKQQFVIWWAGLMRGAVSMALAYHQFTKQGDTRLPEHALMITCTITIVLFSTIVFGLLTKPLMKFLLFSSPALPVSYAATGPNSQQLPLVEKGQDVDSCGIHRFWRRMHDCIMHPLFGGKTPSDKSIC